MIMNTQLLKKIESDLIDYYHQKGALPDASQHVGWKNQWAQEIRFAQLLKVIDSDVNSFSINDLGCGKGALAPFLNKLVSASFRYNGYDLLDSMIAEAKRETQLSQAHFFTIANSLDMAQADYTVASGIFNLKYHSNDDDWLKYIHSTIEVMWRKSDRGIAFNCLTDLSDLSHRKPELFYSNPGAILNFCAKFTRHFALLHNYQEYDFTVLMWKK
jgi:SAM-dependent methyltransferase